MAFIFPVVFLAVGFASADTPTRIFYGNKELSCSPVWDEAGEPYLPASCLRELGISFQEGDIPGTLLITSGSGRSGEVSLREISGSKLVPLKKVLEVTGGELVWDEAKQRAVVYAHLQSVEFVDGILKVNCSFPVTCTTSKWQNKLIVDVQNTRLACEAREVYIGGPVVLRARLGQYTPDTTRVVLDLAQPADMSLRVGLPSAQLIFTVGQGGTKSGGWPVSQAQAPAKANSLNSQVPLGSVERIRLEPRGDEGFDIIVEAAGRVQIAHSYGVKPPRMELTVKAGSVADDVESLDVVHPLIESASIRKTSLSNQQVVSVNLAFVRILAYEVSSAGSVTRVSVRIPNRAGGSLTEKTVVIDPGHGGREKGARWGDIYEKDVNLRIGNAVKAALEREGVRVIMTRSGDSTLGLADRAEVAIRNGADFFISIHCNSNSFPGSASGVETYYHLEEGSSKSLAYAVHTGICSSAKSVDRRVRSDRSLYASGLGVLRRLSGSGIPGVLVECGYLNHPSERSRLLSADYHEKLARGIVAALRAYVEGGQPE
ncbi:MAG: N-acetylmuramoyl-L-alanine amidase [Armatimonadota bacterium]